MVAEADTPSEAGKALMEAYEQLEADSPPEPPLPGDDAPAEDTGPEKTLIPPETWRDAVIGTWEMICQLTPIFFSKFDPRPLDNDEADTLARTSDPLKDEIPEYIQKYIPHVALGGALIGVVRVRLDKPKKEAKRDGGERRVPSGDDGQHGNGEVDPVERPDSGHCPEPAGDLFRFGSET